MTTYTAQFESCTFTRNSDREYGAAWVIMTENGNVYANGFSRDVALAHKAAESALPRFISKRDRNALHMRSHFARYAKERGLSSVKDFFAASDAEVNALRSKLKIEVVAL